MITYRLDRNLMNFAKANRLRYTRYADDISFSSYMQPLALFQNGLPVEGKIRVEQLSPALLTAIRSNGFELNPDKLWFSGRKSRKEVTGLTVNEFTNVKRSFVRNLRAAFYKIETQGIQVAQKNYQEKYGSASSLENVIRGKLEWIAQVRGRQFSAYRTLSKRFNLLFPANAIPIAPTLEETASGAVWVIEFFYKDICRQGTAFFLNNVGLITANHVLDGLPRGEKAEIYRPSDPHVKFKVSPSAQRCPHRDLVILEHNILPDAFSSFFPAKLPYRKNENIFALGYPDFAHGDGLNTRGGHITGRTTKSSVKLIEVSAMLDSGMSGGPIVNEHYEVIAIAQRGGGQESKQLGIEISELLELAKGN